MSFPKFSARTSADLIILLCKEKEDSVKGELLAAKNSETSILLVEVARESKQKIISLLVSLLLLQHEIEFYLNLLLKLFPFYFSSNTVY